MLQNEFKDLGLNYLYKFKNDGTLDYEQLKRLRSRFFFLYLHIMDTFVKVDLEKIKEISNAKIISNELQIMIKIVM